MNGSLDRVLHGQVYEARGLSVRDLDDPSGQPPTPPVHPLLTDEGSAFWRPAVPGIYEARFELHPREPGEKIDQVHMIGAPDYVAPSPWLLVELRASAGVDLGDICDLIPGAFVWRLLDPWGTIDGWDPRQRSIWQFGFWRLASKKWMPTNPHGPEPPVWRILPHERQGRWHVDASRREKAL